MAAEVVWSPPGAFDAIVCLARRFVLAPFFATALLVLRFAGLGGFSPSFWAFRASRNFLILAFGKSLCFAQTIPKMGGATFLQPGTGRRGERAKRAIKKPYRRLLRITGRPVLLAIGLSLWALGWLGAERTFFRDRREGKKVALRDLLASVPLFIGRFLRLGVLVGILVSPMMAVAIVISAWLATAGRAAVAKTTIHVSVITMLVAVDLALTFVTPVLVFTTQSAREALRLGIGIIRQTWPRSGLYVLCPPLALNLLNAMYPTHHLVVILLRTAGFAVLALVAKGATAAFYLRERTVSADVIVGVG